MMLVPPSSDMAAMAAPQAVPATDQAVPVQGGQPASEPWSAALNAAQAAPAADESSAAGAPPSVSPPSSASPPLSTSAPPANPPASKDRLGKHGAAPDAAQPHPKVDRADASQAERPDIKMLPPAQAKDGTVDFHETKAVKKPAGVARPLTAATQNQAAALPVPITAAAVQPASSLPASALPASALPIAADTAPIVSSGHQSSSDGAIERDRPDPQSGPAPVTGQASAASDISASPASVKPANTGGVENATLVVPATRSDQPAATTPPALAAKPVTPHPEGGQASQGDSAPAASGQSSKIERLDGDIIQPASPHQATAGGTAAEAAIPSSLAHLTALMQSRKPTAASTEILASAAPSAPAASPVAAPSSAAQNGASQGSGPQSVAAQLAGSVMPLAVSGGVAHIQLHPDSLGPIAVSVSKDADGKINVVFAPAAAAGLAAINATMHLLPSQMAQSGIVLGSCQVIAPDHRPGGSPSGSSQAGGNPQSGGQPGGQSGYGRTPGQPAEFTQDSSRSVLQDRIDASVRGVVAYA